MTEAAGAGVEAAITQYVRSTPELAHSVLIAGHRGKERIGGNADLNWHASTGLRELAVKLRRSADDFDVVHLHSSVAGAVGRLAGGFKGRTRVVYSPHALAHLDVTRRTRRLLRTVELLLASRATAFGAVSEHEADAIAELGVGRERIIIIPHAVGPAVPLELEARSDLVVAMGRVASQKDPELFATIASSFAIEQNPVTKWKWVGGGDQRLTEVLSNAGADVTGWLTSDLARAQVAAAKLLLHTARYEGLPVAVLEALAAGTPVVARGIPALRGLPVRTFDDWRDGVAALGELRDPEAWSEASELGLDYVRAHFNAERQGFALRQLYGVSAS